MRPPPTWRTGIARRWSEGSGLTPSHRPQKIDQPLQRLTGDGIGNDDGVVACAVFDRDPVGLVIRAAGCGGNLSGQTEELRLLHEILSVPAACVQREFRRRSFAERRDRENTRSRR